MVKHASETFAKGLVKTGTYTGTGAAFDIVTGFEPKRVEIIVEETGEFVTKNKRQAASKCLLRKNYGADQTLKSYILSTNGITVGTDKITVGTSSYINGLDVEYSYTIWG